MKQALMRSKMVDEQKLKNLGDKIANLERYEGIDIDYLLTDSMEKEKVIENYQKEEFRRKAMEKAKVRKSG
jgi:hypothetical protein